MNQAQILEEEDMNENDQDEAEVILKINKFTLKESQLQTTEAQGMSLVKKHRSCI